MRIVLPLIYACSGCSGAGQLANSLALEMDREGHAEMSCTTGVGGGVPAILKLLRSDRKRIVVDGCYMRCAQHCLHAAGVGADLVFNLADQGVEKSRSRDYSEEDFARVVPELRRACKKMLPIAITPYLASSAIAQTGFMRIHVKSRY